MVIHIRYYNQYHLSGKTHKNKLVNKEFTIDVNNDKKYNNLLDIRKVLSELEYSIKYFSNLLIKQIEYALNMYRYRQSKNPFEITNDNDNISIDNNSISSNSEENNTNNNKSKDNPKNLPLGWDGNPIPYWLYKLHGLDKEYKCEICGNYSYFGRKSFERHFNEWRHTYGLKCLKIKNTDEFKEITNINDALILDKKLRMTKRISEFNNESEEEFEDEMGNVCNRKIYEDLKRQNIL